MIDQKAKRFPPIAFCTGDSGDSGDTLLSRCRVILCLSPESGILSPEVFGTGDRLPAFSRFSPTFDSSGPRCVDRSSHPQPVAAVPLAATTKPHNVDCWCSAGQRGGCRPVGRRRGTGHHQVQHQAQPLGTGSGLRASSLRDRLEIPLDAGTVAHCNLNVASPGEASTRVQLASFGERRPDRVIRIKP